MAIAGLGLVPGFTATVPVAGGAAEVVFPDALGDGVLGTDALGAEGDCVAGGLGLTALWFCASTLGFGVIFAAVLWRVFFAVFLVATFVGEAGLRAGIDFKSGNWRVISAAGFIPAAMAILAEDFESGGCLIVPCKSGFTIICPS